MELKELQRRIENKKVEITKIEKRIAKWTKGLRPEDIAVLEPFGNCVYGTAPRGSSWNNFKGTEAYQIASQNYKAYKEREGNNIPSSDDWSKGPSFSEAYSAYRDLGEARNTLNNYIIQLEKMNNFENEEKIEAIWTFLCEWKTKVHNWYLENAKLYLKLKQGYKDARAEWEKGYLEINPEPEKDSIGYSGWRINYRVAGDNFKETYYRNINSLTIDITRLIGHYASTSISCNEYVYDDIKVDEEKLDKILEEEKKAKYQDLVKRVTAVVGNITDAKGLTIGRQHGEINGIVVGDRSKARVETISAGGYNIQVYHYRVLVHELH